MRGWMSVLTAGEDACWERKEISNHHCVPPWETHISSIPVPKITHEMNIFSHFIYEQLRGSKGIGKLF
jgi:hypothetical protein